MKSTPMLYMYDLTDLNCNNTQLQAMMLMEFSTKIKAEHRF